MEWFAATDVPQAQEEKYQEANAKHAHFVKGLETALQRLSHDNTESAKRPETAPNEGLDKEESLSNRFMCLEMEDIDIHDENLDILAADSLIA